MSVVHIQPCGRHGDAWKIEAVHPGIRRSVLGHPTHHAVPLLNRWLNMVVEMGQGCVQPSFILLSLLIRRRERFQDGGQSSDLFEGFKQLIKVIVQQRARWREESSLISNHQSPSSLCVPFFSRRSKCSTVYSQALIQPPNVG